jgi:hypothetical protein
MQRSRWMLACGQVYHEGFCWGNCNVRISGSAKGGGRLQNYARITQGQVLYVTHV